VTAASPSTRHPDDVGPMTAEAGSSSASGSASTDEWKHELRRALEHEPDASLGRRIVVVPDSATAYAVQQACITLGGARRYLTARYVAPVDGAPGTMLVAFAKDVDALANRPLDTLGDLVGPVARLALVFLRRPHGWPGGWSTFVNETVPLAESRGPFEFGRSRRVVAINSRFCGRPEWHCPALV